MMDGPPDRRHNREEDSPEALRESIRELTNAVAKLDRRLDEATLRLGEEIGGARSITRQLATEVGFMGKGLVKQIENIGPAPIKRRPKSMWLLALSVTLGLVLAAASFLMLPK